MSVYDFYKTAKLVHFLHKDSKRVWKDKYNRLRGVADGLGLSPRAKQKLEWIIFSLTVGRQNATYTANYFGITRKTPHKWPNRFNEANLRTFEEKSHAPVKRRTWEVTLKEEEGSYSRQLRILQRLHMEGCTEQIQVSFQTTS